MFTAFSRWITWDKEAGPTLADLSASEASWPKSNSASTNPFTDTMGVLLLFFFLEFRGTHNSLKSFSNATRPTHGTITFVPKQDQRPRNRVLLSHYKGSKLTLNLPDRESVSRRHFCSLHLPSSLEFTASFFLRTAYFGVLDKVSKNSWLPPLPPLCRLGYWMLALLCTVLKTCACFDQWNCCTHLQRHLAVPVLPLPLSFTVAVAIPLAMAVALPTALPVVVLVPVPAAGLVTAALLSGAAVVAFSGPLPPKREGTQAYLSCWCPSVSLFFNAAYFWGCQPTESWRKGWYLEAEP